MYPDSHMWIQAHMTQSHAQTQTHDSHIHGQSHALTHTYATLSTQTDAHRTTGTEQQTRTQAQSHTQTHTTSSLGDTWTQKGTDSGLGMSPSLCPPVPMQPRPQRAPGQPHQVPLLSDVAPWGLGGTRVSPECRPAHPLLSLQRSPLLPRRHRLPRDPAASWHRPGEKPQGSTGAAQPNCEGQQTGEDPQLPETQRQEAGPQCSPVQAGEDELADEGLVRVCCNIRAPMRNSPGSISREPCGVGLLRPGRKATVTVPPRG